MIYTLSYFVYYRHIRDLGFKKLKSNKNVILKKYDAVLETRSDALCDAFGISKEWFRVRGRSLDYTRMCL